MEEIQLISDAEISMYEQDSLEFNRYADILAGIVRGTVGPFTIGVLGDWGTGKTSLLKMVKQKLEGDGDIVTVWFNAWQYEKEEHIVFPFLATIYDSLQIKKPMPSKGRVVQKIYNQGVKSVLEDIAWHNWGKPKQPKKDFKNIRNSLRGIIGGVTLSIPGTPGTLGIPGIQFSAKDALERYEKLTENILKKHSEYKQAFESLTVPEGKKVVVLIDDLDRCNPEKAIHVLESIKLVLNQPGFIFILGIANNILDDYLEEKYKKDYHIKDVHLKDHKYLDKIIQLPFFIPSHEKRITNFIEKFYEENDNLQAIGNFKQMIPLIVLATQYNPRKIKRLLNNLIIDNELIQRIQHGTRGITIPYVFIWQVLEYSYPNLYNLLQKSEHIDFLQQNLDSTIHADVTKTIENDIQKETILEVLNDNNFITIFNSLIGHAWLTNKEQRENALHFHSGQHENEDSQRQESFKRVSKEPKNIDALLEYALILKNAHDLHGAKKYYKMAIDQIEEKEEKKAYEEYNTKSKSKKLQEFLSVGMDYLINKTYSYIRSEEYVPALYSYVDVLYRLQNYDEGHKYEKLALRIKPDSYDFRFTPLGPAINETLYQDGYIYTNEYFDSGEIVPEIKSYQQAEKDYQRQINYPKPTASQLFGYAKLLHQMKNYEKSEHYYKQAIKISPYVDGTHDYLDLLDDLKKYNRAEEILQQCLKSEMNNETLVITLYRYALLLQNMKNYEKSEYYYQKALQIAPEKVDMLSSARPIPHRKDDILSSYANLLHEMNRDAEAEQCYKKAFKISQDYALTHQDYAIFLHNTQRDDEAEEHYQLALKLDSSNPGILQHYALFLHDTQRNDKAQKYFRQALESDPTNSALLNNYANFLQSLENYHGAERYYALSIEANLTLA